MHKLESIAEQIRKDFDARTAARDKALATARQLTRACSLAIRAAHRLETDGMAGQLTEARSLADALRAAMALSTADGLRGAFVVVLVMVAVAFAWFLAGWKRHAAPPATARA